MLHKYINFESSCVKQWCKYVDKTIFKVQKIPVKQMGDKLNYKYILYYQYKKRNIPYLHHK